MDDDYPAMIGRVYATVGWVAFVLAMSVGIVLWELAKWLFRHFVVSWQ